MWRVAVQMDPMKMGISIYAVEMGAMHSSILEGTFSLHTVPNEELHAKQIPMMTMSLMHDAEGFMHALAQALADQGFNRMEPADDRKELQAVKDHLDDMRSIVAVRLEVPLMLRTKP